MKRLIIDTVILVLTIIIYAVLMYYFKGNWKKQMILSICVLGIVIINLIINEYLDFIESDEDNK